MSDKKNKKPINRYKKLTGKILTILFIIVCVFTIITINSYKTISTYLPTWKSLYDDFHINNSVEQISKVHYIDVGQGSCILIQSDGKNVLIDGGDVWAGERVATYIDNLNINKIDYVVATHPHSDHIGGLINVIENIEINNIIMPQLPETLIPTTRIYEKFVQLISSKNINVIPAIVGDRFELGKGYMYVLGPNGLYDNLNDMSVGIKFTYGDIEFLSTGDMGNDAEIGLINSGHDLSADVFALSHHGSKYGNIDNLLDKINAKYYIAQCGYGNEYGHPHNEVINSVSKRNGIFLRNDFNGNIVFSTNGTDLTLNKQKE